MSASSIMVMPALQMSAWTGETGKEENQDIMVRIEDVAYREVIGVVFDGLTHHNFWSHPGKERGGQEDES